MEEFVVDDPPMELVLSVPHLADQGQKVKEKAEAREEGHQEGELEHILHRVELPRQIPALARRVGLLQLELVIFVHVRLVPQLLEVLHTLRHDVLPQLLHKLQPLAVLAEVVVAVHD